MRKINITNLAGSFIIAALLAGASTAYASDDDDDNRGGKITKIERSITITRSGAYMLTRSINSSEETPVITITANNVSLDLNGHSLTGPGNIRGIGVSIDGANNVSVTNGQLASFNIGVRISDSNNIKVNKIQISGDDIGRVAPDAEIGVLILNSRGVDVGHNVISNTFLGIFVRGGGSGANLIHDNTLASGTTGRLGICYNPAPGLDDGPAGDLVYNNLISGYAIGIQTSPQSRNNVFTENTIAFTNTGIQQRTEGNNIFEDNTLVPLN